MTTASRMEELKAELSSARRKVSRTSEGKLGPQPRRTGDTPREIVRERLDDHDRLARMAERGEIKLGSGRIPADFWTMARPEDPSGEVMQALLDERESSR